MEKNAPPALGRSFAAATLNGSVNPACVRFPNSAGGRFFIAPQSAETIAVGEEP